MQIVIDIPEELYNEYVSVNLGRGNGKTITYNLLKAIKNGTPLSKNHGRLIDVDALYDNTELVFSEDGFASVTWRNINDAHQP